MKASVLTGEVNLVLKKELDLKSQWKHLFQKLASFCAEPFESDWEQKTGLDWQEWGKYPHIQ